MRKSSLNDLVYGNRFELICVFFTVATLLDLIICIAQGYMDISYKHLADRFILCTLAAFSLMIFRYFKSLQLYAILLIHFFICIIMMLFYAWSGSLYMELHPNAYRDAVRTIFILYPVIVIGGLIVDAIRTAKANKILKKN